MTNETEKTGPAARLPDADVEKTKGGPSIIWLVPLIAAAVAAWLAYTTWAAKGPEITITFDAASGIEPGKTRIKHRDVELGVVSDVRLSDDIEHVIVTAQMDKAAAAHLRDETTFWIESPQLTAAGISGLGTLVSGVYIGILPGEGKARRHFTGLNQPPVMEVKTPGRRFELHAAELGSVSAGSGLYFRGLNVGEVLGYTLDADGAGVSMSVFVRKPYDDLIRDETHFWNASGIDASFGAAGLQVRTASLAAVLSGGIAFETPLHASAGPPSNEGAVFALYPSYDSIGLAKFTTKVPYLLYFDGSVGGLEVGAPVRLRGITVGAVTDIRLEVDLDSGSVRIPVFIEIEPQRATIIGASDTMPPHEGMSRLVAKGLRAQLQSASLLTGALLVALDFFPAQPAAAITEQNGHFVIPTEPSEADLLMSKATQFIDKLTKAPIAELIADLRTAVRDADKLLGSKALQRGIDEIAPLLDSLRQASDTARGTLAQADTTLQSAGQLIGPDSTLRYDLVRLLDELTNTARSLRTLADYLERNPNSLIFGKSPGGE